MTIAKARRKPFFGPLLVAIIASPLAHATVPEWEQVVTAGLTGYAMELAASALGVGAAWKSGRHLDGGPLVRLLRLGPHERLLGWINLGTEAAARGLDRVSWHRTAAAPGRARDGAGTRSAHRA